MSCSSRLAGGCWGSSQAAPAAWCFLFFLEVPSDSDDELLVAGAGAKAGHAAGASDSSGCSSILFLRLRGLSVVSWWWWNFFTRRNSVVMIVACWLMLADGSAATPLYLYAASSGRARGE